MEELEGLVTFMAQNLVEDPETVQVISQARGRIVTVTLTVPQDDMGKVIGRQGRIAEINADIADHCRFTAGVPRQPGHQWLRTNLSILNAWPSA